MTLYHYTCDHGRSGIGDSGFIKPSPTFWQGTPLIWLTDMETPDRLALGLTSQILRCDRLDYRYLVGVCAAPEPWLTSRYRFEAPIKAVLMLEAIDGVQPTRWWVSPVRLFAAFDKGYAKPEAA